MDLSELKTKLEKDLESIGYHLYSLNYFKKDKILEVLIDEELDLDGISKLSEKVSKFMDKYDEEFDEYLLDVASAGCEREIKDIGSALNLYVHLETDKLNIDGTLIDYKDDVLEIEYLDKTRKKVAKINKQDVKKIRHAVKF